ncbi:IclR family transcriptional regulator [Rhodobacter sp. NSM]|uniref:IclR family transcriptional regulator n=1 Tax=Rhodobacter sp. NSM TaxID=3457501 RepID=UPI003FD0ABCB
MSAPRPPRLRSAAPAPAGLRPARSGPAAVEGSQSVQRALSLLSLAGRAGDAGAGLAQLAVGTGLARPTVRRLLMALVAARLVEQDPGTRRYHLGPEAYLLGTFAAPRHGILTHAADSLRRLAAESGDTAFLSVQQDAHVLCLHREEGSFPIRTHALKAGDRNPLGVGGGGLAILAALPEAEARVLRARMAPMLKERGGPSSEDLLADEMLARERGYAINPGRVVQGSWGMGVAVHWPDGRPAAALTLAMIEDRMSPARQPALVALLQREAALVEARLARLFSPDPNDPLGEPISP